MFNRLRRRVIVLVMTIAGIILTGLFGALCVTNYIQITQAGYNSLERLVRSDRPGELLDGEVTERPKDDRIVMQSGMLKITAWYDADGLLKIEKDNVFLFNISEEELYKITNTALQSGKTKGFIKGYDLRYYKATNPDGKITVAYAKAGYEREYMLKLILISVLAVVSGIVVVFLISLPVSKAFVAPTEKAWEQQQRFIADVSHELKTPLTVILANTDILLNHKDKDGSNSVQWLNSTQEEATQMKHLLDEMLYLAKSDARLLQTERTEFDLSDVVVETALPFDSVAYENGVEIETDVESEVIISASETDVRRLLTILIDNAVKYSYKNTKINITVKKIKNKAVVTVRNFGQIIKGEEIPFIFDRFYRGDKSRSKAVYGFGLGLPIAKEIVDSHGGEIRCESAEADGTTFTVILPAKE